MRQRHTNLMREYDNIYYNVSINSDNNNRYSIPKQSISRTENILDKASDYYVSVIRFNIPSTFVPILVFVPESPNSLIGAYSITLSYKNDSFEESLIYSNRGNGSFSNSSLGFYYVYDFQQMVDMINTALADAMAAIKINFPSPDPVQTAVTPFMIYDPVTKLFAFYSDNEFFNPVIGGGQTIKMFMNDQLWTLFNSFPNQRNYFGQVLNQASGEDIQILITNNGNNLTMDPNGDANNTTTYVYTSQEFTTIYNWNPFKKIVITTTSLPVIGENVDSTGNNQRTILTDFVPSVSATEFRTVYQYFPTSQYRLIDLTNDGPLKAFDVNVWWEDINGDLNLIYLPWNSQIEVKLAFVKKSMYINEDMIDIADVINRRELYGDNGDQKIYKHLIR